MYKMMLQAAAMIGALMVHAQAAEPVQAVEADDAKDVYFLMTVAVPNMDALKPIMDKLLAATEQETGAFTYVYTMTPDKKRVDIFQHYKDSAAALDHVKNTVPYQKDFFAAAKQESFTVYGPANDDLKKALEPSKPTYMQFFAGFLAK